MQPLNDLPPILTIEEVAKFLRISRSSAYEAATRGEIPTVRLGRRLRVPRSALEAMLNGKSPPENEKTARLGGFPD